MDNNADMKLDTSNTNRAINTADGELNAGRLSTAKYEDMELDANKLGRAKNNTDTNLNIGGLGGADKIVDTEHNTNRLGWANKTIDTEYNANGANNTLDADRANNIKKEAKVYESNLF